MQKVPEDNQRRQLWACHQCNPDKCPPHPRCEGKDCPVFDINYKKNDVYLYEEKVLKVSNIELSNSKKNGRLLEDNSGLTEKSTITSKYLINIYDYDENEKVYYAYAAVIDMNKQVESKKSENYF